MTGHLNLFLKDNNLLQLLFNQLLELKDGLVPLVASQDDIKLRQCRLVLVELSLHQGVVIHQSLRSSDLLQQKFMQARGVVLSEHVVSVAFN